MSRKMQNNTIYSRFSQWMKSQPDTVAVTEDGRSTTYRELDRMADAIMAKFQTEHYAAVGIVMSHSTEMIAAMLAVLKSGAAYVPAEPSLPQERIDYMMRTAGVDFIITDGFCRNHPSSEPLSDKSVPDGVAYILYTSGTSGRPKGVVVENHSVVNYAEAFENEFHVAPGDVMLQYSICSFDILSKRSLPRYSTVPLSPFRRKKYTTAPSPTSWHSVSATVSLKSAVSRIFSPTWTAIIVSPPACAFLSAEAM